MLEKKVQCDTKVRHINKYTQFQFESERKQRDTFESEQNLNKNDTFDEKQKQRNGNYKNQKNPSPRFK